MKSLKKEWNNFNEFLQHTPKVVFIVFAIYFMQGVVHNLGHPVTPALLQDDMMINDYYFGLYFAAMSLGLLLGSPIWGVLGDKGHKRVYIFVGLLVYSVGQYAFAFVGDKNWMILFRFLSGFGVSASITLIMSHLIEYSPEKYRTVHLGLYQGLFVLGASVGYWIGGNLPEMTWFVETLHMDNLRNIFFLQAIVNVIHAIYIFFLIGKDTQVHEKSTWTNPLQGFLDIKKLDKNLIIFLLSLALISLGAINVSKFLEFYMDKVELDTSDIGNFVGLTGVVSIIATFILVPIVTRFKRDFTFMTVIQLISAILIFIIFRSNQFLLMLYTLFMLYVVLKAVYTPLEQHYISSHAKPGEYGKIMGVRQSFFSIGLVIGPLMGGFLYDINPQIVFDVSALMFILGFILLLIVGRNIRQNNLSNTD